MKLTHSLLQALRYFTSAFIRTHSESFAPFLMHPETFTPMDVSDFCSAWVEPTGKEADQVMIQALARCLRQGIKICYLDGSSSTEEDGGASFVEFEYEEGEGVGEDPLMLLYRPGHYDVLALTTVH
jgi:ubiquitin thioesterase protein OTUB1